MSLLFDMLKNHPIHRRIFFISIIGIALAIIFSSTRQNADVSATEDILMSATQTLFQILLMLSFIQLWIFTFKRINKQVASYEKFMKDRNVEIRERIEKILKSDPANAEIDFSKYQLKIDTRSFKKEKKTSSLLFGTVILVNLASVITNFLAFTL